MGSTQGQRVLVVDQIAMLQYLLEKNYALVWAVLSEKSAWNGTAHAGGISRQSAVYVLADDGEISGGHTVTKTESPEKLMR